MITRSGKRIASRDGEPGRSRPDAPPRHHDVAPYLLPKLHPSLDLMLCQAIGTLACHI